MEVPLSIPTDSQGFTSQQCGKCQRIFKVQFGNESKQQIAFCPYCGHQDDNYWTPGLAQYIGEVAVRATSDQLTDILKQATRGSKSFQVTGGKFTGPEPTPPIESEDEMQVHVFECCNERIKHVETSDPLKCITCGRISDLPEQS